MAIEIRPFTMDLYDDIFSLWRKCEGVGLGESDSKKSIEKYLKRNPGLSFAALKKDKIVGAVLAGHGGYRGYLHHLAVRPDCRRQGIARLLANACLEQLKQENIAKCHLFLFKTNDTGKKFWEAAGWSQREDLKVVSALINNSR